MGTTDWAAFDEVLASQGALKHIQKPPPWLEAVNLEIENLTLLEEDWDGHMAKRVTDLAVKAAESAIKQLTEVVSGLKRPGVVPTFRGGIQFEWWQSGQEPRMEFDIEFTGDSIEMLYGVTGEQLRPGIVDSLNNEEFKFVDPVKFLYTHFREEV